MGSWNVKIYKNFNSEFFHKYNNSITTKKDYIYWIMEITLFYSDSFLAHGFDSWGGEHSPSDMNKITHNNSNLEEHRLVIVSDKIVLANSSIFWENLAKRPIFAVQYFAVWSS